MEDIKLTVEKVLEDKEFVEKVLSLEEPEDVQKAFEEKGINLSLDDVNALGNALKADEGDELNESSLEDVAGGSAVAVIGLVAAGLKLYLSARKAWDARW